MNTNEVIQSLGGELDKLIQKTRTLKEENETLKKKNQSLEEQLKSSSTEDETIENLVRLTNQIKNINQDEEESAPTSHSSLTEEMTEINPNRDY